MAVQRYTAHRIRVTAATGGQNYRVLSGDFKWSIKEDSKEIYVDDRFPEHVYLGKIELTWEVNDSLDQQFWYNLISEQGQRDVDLTLTSWAIDEKTGTYKPIVVLKRCYVTEISPEYKTNEGIKVDIKGKAYGFEVKETQFQDK